MLMTTFTDQRASDVIVYEEPTARFSREAVRVTAAVKIGDLLKESATAGVYEPAQTIADLELVRYISIMAADDIYQNGAAAIARHAIVRAERLNWPAGATEANKKSLADRLEANYQLLIRNQGI